MRNDKNRGVKKTMGRLLTLQELAQRLQISETTLYKLARRGKIPVIKVGNQWRFKIEDIDKWLESQKISQKKKKKNEQI